MGFFENIGSGNFQKDQNGKTVFFPWGIWSRGRVLPDDDSEKRICAFLVRYYKISLPVMMASMVLFGVPWGFLPVLILMAWYYFGLKPLVGDFAYGTEKLTIKEALSKSATNHSRFTLWSIFVSLFFLLRLALL